MQQKVADTFCEKIDFMPLDEDDVFALAGERAKREEHHSMSAHRKRSAVK